MQIWDLAARKQKHSILVSNDTLFGASFSPDGARIACGAADKSIRLFDVATGKEIRKMDHHEDWVFGAIFGVDGKRLVSVSRDKAAKLADANTGAFIENVNQVFGELERYMQVGILRADPGMAPELVCWPLKR